MGAPISYRPFEVSEAGLAYSFDNSGFKKPYLLFRIPYPRLVFPDFLFETIESKDFKVESSPERMVSNLHQIYIG
jgi:hypothetical protein